MRRTGWLLLAASCAVSEPSVHEPAPGVIKVVDAGGPSGDTGYWPALALDPEGRLHLAYCDLGRGDVRYATREAGGLRLETVAAHGRVGKYVALALKPDGTPAVSFYDQDAKLLRYAERQPSSGGWTSERVAWGLEVGMGSRLLFDGDGVAHLFFYLPSGELAHATRPQRRRDGDWPRQLIARAGGAFDAAPSVKAHAGSFVAAFLDWDFERSRLLLARPLGAGFAVEPWGLESDAGRRAQLTAVSPAPQVLYGRAEARELRRATFGAPSELVGRGVGAFAATLTPSGELAIAVEADSPEPSGVSTLELWRGTSLPLRRLRVDDDGPVGDHLAIAADARGRAVIAYHARPIRGLKLYDETLTEP